MNAGWDAEMLSLELADLSGMGADLSTLGFTSKELSRALSRVESGLTDEDEVPEIAEVAVSRSATSGSSDPIASLAAIAEIRAW